MTVNELIAEVDAIIDETRVAVLATADAEGHPHVRWMTPVLLAGRPGALYAVTASHFRKVAHIRAHAEVEWMFQTKALDRIVLLRGRVNRLDNPAIRSEVLEVLGPRLRTFWKVNPDTAGLVVLETIVEEGVRFLPMKGVRETVAFPPGGSGASAGHPSRASARSGSTTPAEGGAR